MAEARRQRRISFDAPVQARFGSTPVIIKDGARFGIRIQHGTPLIPGEKAQLQYQLHAGSETVSIAGRVVWSHLATRESTAGIRRYESGIRIEQGARLVDRLLALFRGRPDIALPDGEIEARRQGRVIVNPPASARFGLSAVSILDLSFLGVRVRHHRPIALGTSAQLSCTPPGIQDRLSAQGTVVWTRLESAPPGSDPVYVSGIGVEDPLGLAEALLFFQAYSGAEPDLTALEKKRRKIVDRIRRAATMSASRPAVPVAPVAPVAPAAPVAPTAAPVARLEKRPRPRTAEIPLPSPKPLPHRFGMKHVAAAGIGVLLVVSGWLMWL